MDAPIELANVVSLGFDGTVYIHLDGWLHLEPLEEWMAQQPTDVEFDSLFGESSIRALVNQAVLACIPGGEPGVVADQEACADLQRLATVLEAEAQRLRSAASGVPFEPSIATNET